YTAGVYFPDKTSVGWWKNGYPEYFAKVLNSTNWIGINVFLDGTELDLAYCKVSDFVRELNMKEGTLSRRFKAELEDGKQVQVEAPRLVSMARHEVGAIRYASRPLNRRGTLRLVPYLDGDVQNKDSNYDEKFWLEVEKAAAADISYLTLKTKKLDFHVTSVMAFDVFKDGNKLEFAPSLKEREKFVSSEVAVEAAAGEQITLYKYVANVTSRNHGLGQLV